jgi:hypothetical protein
VIHFLEPDNLKIFVVNCEDLEEIQCVERPYPDTIH